MLHNIFKNKSFSFINYRFYCKHSHIRKEFIKHLHINPSYATEFAENLNEESRRSLIETLLKEEAKKQGKNIKYFFKQADSNDDGIITEKEFTDWITHRSWFPSTDQVCNENNIINYKDKEIDETTITTKQSIQLFIQVAIPFIGFGFLDNAIMIFAGNTIENSIGITLGLSTLAAAGIGNLLSDVAGIGLGNSIEAGASLLGLPNPNLSKKQDDLRIVKWIRFGAGVIGIAFGCILGMFPLLFITSQEEATLRRIFDTIDENKNGVIDFYELEIAFNQLGIEIHSSELQKFFDFIDVDKNGVINFEEFTYLVHHLTSMLDPKSPKPKHIPS